MKNQQHEQARDLYFQTNLSKTEIADKVNVNRRTILLWSQQGNWDRLRQSARHMPALIAEKCYHLLDQYTTHLLSSGNVISTFGLKQAQAIHLLASAIKKIKNHSTTNESMEMFSGFMEGLNKRDSRLAADVLPHIENYINARESVTASDFLPGEFAPDGTIPHNEKEEQERLQDEIDQIALMEEFELFLQSRSTAKDDLSAEAPAKEDESASAKEHQQGPAVAPLGANDEDDEAAAPIVVNTTEPIIPSPLSAVASAKEEAAAQLMQDIAGQKAKVDHQKRARILSTASHHIGKVA